MLTWNASWELLKVSGFILACRNYFLWVLSQQFGLLDCMISGLCSLNQIYPLLYPSCGSTFWCVAWQLTQPLTRHEAGLQTCVIVLTIFYFLYLYICTYSFVIYVYCCKNVLVHKSCKWETEPRDFAWLNWTRQLRTVKTIEYFLSLHYILVILAVCMQKTGTGMNVAK